MFEDKKFISHSGKKLDWKINCDSLRSKDYKCLAARISKKLSFGEVVGIPRGGLRLAKFLKPYITYGPRLVVDDVYTTGASMRSFYKEGDIGVVIFSRTREIDKWVNPIFIYAL